MNDVNFDLWFNNTVLTKTIHTDDVMVATFQHPGTIMYSITYTLLAHPQSIQITGDAGQAVFSPTWNPVRKVNYETYATGYILEKLNCCRRDEADYTLENIESDWDDFSKDYEDEPEYLKAVRKIVDDVLIPNVNSEQFDIWADAREEMNNPEVEYQIDVADLPDILSIGARPNSNKLIFVEGLRRLEKYGAFDKDVNKIVIGNPDEFKY